MNTLIRQSGRRRQRNTDVYREIHQTLANSQSQNWHNKLLMALCSGIKTGYDTDWKVFTARRNACIASAVLATAIPSVRPSISLSVCHTPVLCQNDCTQHGAVCTVSKMCLQRVHEKTPPRYNGVLIPWKTSLKFLQQNLAFICTLCAKISGNLT